MPRRPFPAFTYINSKGRKYYVRERTTKRGKTTYKATLSPRGSLYHLPNGYQVIESPNGVVSVVRERERKVTAEEEKLIHDAVKRINPHTLLSRVWGDEITVYQRTFNAPELQTLIASIDPRQEEEFQREFLNPSDLEHYPTENDRRLSASSASENS